MSAATIDSTVPGTAGSLRRGDQGRVGRPYSLAFVETPGPAGDSDAAALLVYAPDVAEMVVDAASRGAPLERYAFAAGGAPDEKHGRAVERQLRRDLSARARRNWGSALRWLLLGPALTLLWINLAPAAAVLFFWLPPLAQFVESLGASSGGMLLAAVVGLAPLAWAWNRAWAALRQALYWGRLARYVSSRRYRQSPLHAQADPRVAGFQADAGSLVARLRGLVELIPDKPSDAAAEGADAARQLHLLAFRHGLPEVAQAYHGVYTQLGMAERRIARQERADTGILGERKLAREGRRAQRAVRTQLARFRPGARTAGAALAPVNGVLLGALGLAGVLLLTGSYLVTDDRAVVVESAGGRIARALGGLGVAEGEGPPAEVVRAPGLHWTWPAPLTSRHSVSLGQQRTVLRARFRQSAPDMVDVVELELRFRITDLDRWARLDADGNGTARLSAQLSSLLEEFVSSARQAAAQELAQQNPGLANDRMQLMARADQLVESRMDQVARAFVSGVSTSSGARQAGIQVLPEHRFQIARGVRGELAGSPGQG